MGLIKKASWNKADLAVVYRVEEPFEDFEIAADNFFSPRQPVDTRGWPGLKSAYWMGIGRVRFASTNRELIGSEKNERHWEFLKKELSHNRIVVIVEAQPGVTVQVRQLLTDTGNEIFVRE